jgi:simple sugar transport system permease protein
MSIKIGSFELTVERKARGQRILWRFLGPFLALLLAFLCTAFIIILSGKNPFLAFRSMFDGAFGSLMSITETLVKTTPLLLAGLGLTIAYRTGLSSIGAEGQMIIGGLLATLVGIYLGFLPPMVLLPLTVLAGMIGGGLWAGIAGYLKARLGISEVINTIMMNYIATYFVAYLLDGPLREPPGYFPQSAKIAPGAWLLVLVPRTRLHAGFLLAAAAVFFVYFLLWKSPLGFQMRAVGFNPIAARANGISVRKNIVLALALSGALAGLAGMSEIAGIHRRLMSGFSSEYGFDAMAVALLGKLNPFGVVISALFFGALRVGANQMQRTVQVPASLVFVIQGLVILFVLMDLFIRNYVIKILRIERAPSRLEEEL